MRSSFLGKLKHDSHYLFGYNQPKYGPENTISYDLYWQTRRDGERSVLSHWQKERADAVLDIIKPGSRVLDLGCGDGAVLRYFQDKAAIKGLGVDVSSHILEQAKKSGIETLTLDISDIEQLKQLPEVDYITGFEIIEHMPNAEEMIYHLINKARSGLIFSMPNSGYYIYRLRLLSGKFPMQWVAHPAEHLRYWTVRDMKFWVKTLGLHVEKLILYEGLPFLDKIWPGLFAQGMIVYIQKESSKAK